MRRQFTSSFWFLVAVVLSAVSCVGARPRSAGESASALATPPRGSADPTGGRIGHLLRNQAAAINACYERVLMWHPSVSGAVRVWFVVAESGGFTDVRVEPESPFPQDELLVACVRDVIVRLVLVPGPEFGEVHYTTKFVFAMLP